MSIRIVIAEDFPLVREAIAGALGRDPRLQVVGEATTGREAIALAQELRPDILLLDLVMPDGGGMVVLDALRMSHPQIRIIVLTASERAGVVLDAVAAGAVGYLSKRAVGEELRQAVVAAHGGGSIVTPALAAHVVKEFSCSARGERSPTRPLEGRELDVVRLVADGMTDDEIAERLVISARTVQTTLERVRDKTGLRRRTELTRWAVTRALA
jgi:DNA-binding NarL/FixJ family response regulator